MTESIKKVLSKLQLSEKSYTIYGDKVSEHWLQYLKIDNKIHLFRDYYSAWLTYNKENNRENYLILVNIKINRIPNKFLQEETLNSGAWVAIINELDLSLKEDTSNAIIEIINSEWDINNRGLKQINIEREINGFNIKNCFPDICLYKIISDRFSKEETLNQITGIVLTEDNGYHLLRYTPQVLQEFKNTFQNGNENIPFENILVSYLASDFNRHSAG